MHKRSGVWDMRVNGRHVVDLQISMRGLGLTLLMGSWRGSAALLSQFAEGS